MASFEEKLKFGRMGEEAVVRWLNSRGQHVLPMYEFSGDGAPSWRLGTNYIVAPDLFSAGDGRSCFLEVKTYERSVELRKIGALVHGVKGRLFDHYMRVHSLTGTPVWLAVVELRTGEVLGCDLAKIETIGCVCRGCADGMPCRGAMERGVYWRRSDMVNLFLLDRETLGGLRLEHMRLFPPN